MTEKPLFDVPFLASRFGAEYQSFRGSAEEAALLARLRKWANRAELTEASTDGAFVKQFFCQTWGYDQQGDTEDGAFHCWPQFAVQHAGQRGGTGQCDLAMGNFHADSGSEIGVAQVLCEFKDVRSALDKPQARKGNSRSPVEQCLDYLRESRTQLSGTELVEPYWAVATDMNEFRLYCAKHYRAQHQRFVISPKSGDDAESLLADTESAALLRFLFWKLFQREQLLSERGPSPLQRLLDEQIVHEQALEKKFYLEYRAYREFLFTTIKGSNPCISATPGQLVRLTQRFLDRCLFVLFCEDMGLPLFPGDLLRNVLADYSQDRYYNPEDGAPWDRLKSIFAAMRDGGLFGDQSINKFNGGLFAPLPELENLRIPAKVFCAKGQADNHFRALDKHPLTLLYFSAKYNFGIKDASGQQIIDLYTLGRIFEQSITELEIMEAEAEGRDSINLLSQRKRDGVYYTPEWVTSYLVQETVGVRLADLKRELDLTPENEPTPDDVEKYRRFLADRRFAAPVAGNWVAALLKYQARLNKIRIVDPACGSGAFLIQALEFLKSEHRWIHEQLESVRGHAEIWETEEVTRAILNNNLYGVDINPESVEITKLALWLHTAVAGKPLSKLDHNVQCGNSLVDVDFGDFYRNKHQSLFADLDEAKRERINAFDWHAAFPEVFANGGFDCVIGNPPYVKLQNFRRVESDVAEYLVESRMRDGRPRYPSTQGAGNFDLYMPFIDKGIQLLNPKGRMGYIAPNVWMVNKYGAPLRNWLKQHPHLDRWIDFKSFQVFDEATTYTALQFFQGSPAPTLKCIFAHDGEIANANWNAPDAQVSIDGLDSDHGWNFVMDEERQLIAKVNDITIPLGNGQISKHISQGVITSAAHIYLLRRVGDSRFIDSLGNEIVLEKEIMQPIISGLESQRYQTPRTCTYILFPYMLDENGVRLFDPFEMQSDFPNSWKYLKGHEHFLRNREHGAFDDDQWYRFGRNQNLDKQKVTKLCISRLVPNLRVSLDELGQYFLNDNNMYGLIASDLIAEGYLLGILNAPVADFVFRRISRPKASGYFQADRQFLAPLPIPDATDDEKRDVGDRAMQLQELHTKRRDLLEKLSRWLAGSQLVDDTRVEVRSLDRKKRFTKG